MLSEKDTPFRVRLAWTIPDGATVDQFVVMRDGAVIARVPGTDTGYVDRDVSPEGTYSYAVEATRGNRHSPPSAVEATLSVPPLGMARLEGYFDVHLKVTSSSGYSNDFSGGLSAGWHFKPLCRHGACDVVWSDIASKGAHARGARHRTRYHISYHGFYGSTCRGAHATSTVEINLRITKARVRHGEWVATRIEGSFDESEAEQLGCGASNAAANVLGRSVAG